MKEQLTKLDEEVRQSQLREARALVENLVGNPDVAEEVAILKDHINLELGESVDWTALQSVCDRVVGELDGFPNTYLQHSGEREAGEGAPGSVADVLQGRFGDSEVLGLTGLLYLRRGELGIGNDIAEDLRRSLALFRAQAYMERSLRGSELPVTSFRIGRAIFAASKHGGSINPIDKLNAEGKRDQLALAAAKFNSAQARTTGQFKDSARRCQGLVEAWRLELKGHKLDDDLEPAPPSDFA
jgi:hypothetical protein